MATDPPSSSDPRPDGAAGEPGGGAGPLQQFVVPADSAGERLDRALTELLDGVSRARVQEWIREGGVQVDGQVVTRPSQHVPAGTGISVRAMPSVRERAGAAPEVDFEVLHVDDAILVVNKPAGMVVHPSNTVRGRTLSELAQERYGPLPTPQGEERHGVVHRLDAETSGVLVMARTAAAGEELKRQFRAREVKKLYLALVHGVPRFDADWIEAPLGRSPRSPDRISVMPEGEGRDARTFYEVRERYERAALLACKPVTGRTHQIRVHLESIEHPVIADKLYKGLRGKKESLPKEAPRLDRHALHAHQLAFVHPASGAPMEFEVPLPSDLQTMRAWLAG